MPHLKSFPVKPFLALAATLAACAHTNQPTAQVPEPPYILIQQRGDDGAASGQEGTVFLTIGGNLDCTLRADDVYLPTVVIDANGEAFEEVAVVRPDAPPHRFTTNTPGLYNALHDLIVTHGAPGPGPEAPNRAVFFGEGGAVHIPPEDFGFFSPLAGQAGALIATASEWRCLPWG